MKSHSKKKNNNVEFWQVATVVLAILFIASVFTNGFSNRENVSETIATDISTALQSAGLITAQDSSQAEEIIKETLNPQAEEETTVPKGSTVDKPLPVELYVMSQCPYGVQAENTMFEAI